MQKLTIKSLLISIVFLLTPSLLADILSPSPTITCGTLMNINSNTYDNWVSQCPSYTREGRNAKYFSFTLDEDSIVTIDLASSSDTYMYLLSEYPNYSSIDERGNIIIENNDDGGEGYNSRITRSLVAGTYTIEATTYGRNIQNRFTLNLQVQSDNEKVDCISHISLNEDKEGTWSNSCKSTNRNSRYAKFYTFTLENNSDVIIDLTSSKDTYLYLLDGNTSEGNVIIKNDDGGERYNSRISKHLEAGTYTLEATTYSANTTGVFTVNVKSKTVEAINCIDPISFNEDTNASWSASCASQNRAGAYAKYYTFTLDSQKEVTINLNSSHDTYMFLLDGNTSTSSQIFRNDDGGEGYNSKILQTLEAGSYTVEATTYRRNILGDFTVNVEADFSDDNNDTNVSTGLIINDITDDNHLTGYQDWFYNVTITGRFEGQFNEGNIVTIFLNEREYYTTLNGDSTWSIDVLGSEFWEDVDKRIEARITMNDQTEIATFKTYSTDSMDYTPTIGIEVNTITEDNIINPEESGAIITLSGTVSSNYVVYSNFTIILNGIDYIVPITDNNYQDWFVEIAGSEFIDEPTLSIELRVSGTDPLGNIVEEIRSISYEIDLYN